MGEDLAVTKLESICERVVIADLIGRMGDVELAWSAATRLEVDEPHTARGSQQVSGVMAPAGKGS